MDIIVIVAKYKENIDWTKKLNIPFIVFNKNPDEAHLFDFNLPNKGRETDTFLNYIINNYENLPDYIAFLQGDPFDHCSSILDSINNFKFNIPFKSLGKVYYRDGNHILEQTLDWAKFCEIEIFSKPKFISGMQCIVSRDLIKKRSKESYEKIYSKVSKELNLNAHTGYYFEYLWPTILNFNEDLQEDFEGCV